MEREALRLLMEEIGEPFEVSMPQTYYEINEGLWEQIERGELTRAFVRVERFRRFLKWYHIDKNPAEINDQYLDIFQQCNFLMEDAALVCRRLSEEKRLAIVTNGTASVQRVRLERSGLLPYFSHLFISEEIGMPKPHPAFFDAVLSQMEGIDRRRVLIVGDSLSSDIQGGVNAGIDTCWFRPKAPAQPPALPITMEISALRQLLEIV
jgi:YjjG family noncanonical pyrimidine nucleotidase